MTKNIKKARKQLHRRHMTLDESDYSNSNSPQPKNLNPEYTEVPHPDNPEGVNTNKVARGLNMF